MNIGRWKLDQNKDELRILRPVDILIIILKPDTSILPDGVVDLDV